ncbi:Fatty acyl-CoA elongase/Polyunsaturated fatty acid specific elongation enzyme [Sorochytrium milnesiophthora]
MKHLLSQAIKGLWIAQIQGPEMPYLSPLLRSAYTAVTGQSIERFNFEQAPLSDNLTVYSSGLLYLVVIFTGRWMMKQAEPLKLRTLFFAHNMLLTVVSAVLFVLLADQVYDMWSQHGLFWSMCNLGALGKEIEVLYYLNYLTKYYELLDTVFLVLKKKNLDFLHWYHHSLTMILCFVQLQGRPSVQWVPILLNLFVHIAMYGYYAQTALGQRPWYKKYITTLQITQFVIDLVAVYFAAYNYWASTHRPWLPHYGTCSGSVPAAFFGCALLTSYLGLFVQFFAKTYKSRSAANAAAKKVKTQ